MAKPTLALIPASQGSKVFSVLPSSGVGDFDFSRGSAATRINSQGLIENVASGQSRLDYPLIDGVVNGCPSVLLEPQRTNLLAYSEDFSNAYWTKAGASVVSGFTSPDGTANAFKLVEDTSTAGHFLYNAQGGDSKTFSFFAKSLGNQYVAISYDGGNNFNFFDIINGQLGTITDSSKTSKIENYGNGWFRCSLYNGSSVFGATIWMSKDGINTSYAGDGTSGVYIYGAQLEQGSYPTSYIPTNGTAVTRLAETANGAGDATTFNDSEGVLMVEMSALSDDSSLREIALSDGSISNRIELRYGATSNKLQFIARSGAVIEANISSDINNILLNNKVAVKYKSNDFALWVNGFELGVDNSGLSPIGLSELSFDDGSGIFDFYGKTKQIQYFQTALTDSEIEQLTSWTSFTAMATSQLYSIK